MQMNETAVIAMLEKEFDDCPFQEPEPEDIAEEAEDVAVEDMRIQANDSGKLGANLIDGTPGVGNNIKGGKPPSFDQKRIDTDNNSGGQVNVKDDDSYDYIVAAHHLIPGNAALKKSLLHKRYMSKKGRGSKVLVNIGYDVNGSHNGVWLPGNYAIRKKRCRKSWGKLIDRDPDWCWEYMLACVRKKRRQFHDTHTAYSTEVLKYLGKACLGLELHREECKECKKKKKKEKMPPPYLIKRRLYAFSKFLRVKLAWPIQPNGLPWVTSDRFKPKLTEKLRLQRYDEI